MPRWWLLIGLCAWGACGKHDDTDKRVVRAKESEPAAATAPATPAEPAKPAALAGITVTAGGKPVAMTEAYLKRLPAQRYAVFLTDHNSSCEELLSNLFSSHDGEHTLLAELGHRLAPDGTLSSEVIRYYERGGDEPKPGSKATVTEKGDHADVALDVIAGALEVHGMVSARMCGDDDGDKSGRPKAPHASSATIEVAGHKLPLAGAIVRGDEVTLSTSPKDCSSSTPWAEAVLVRKDGFWSMTGEWLEQEASNPQAPDPKMQGVKIKRGAKGKSDDGPTVQLAVSGKGTVGKYAVALDGTIEAIDCPK